MKDWNRARTTIYVSVLGKNKILWLNPAEFRTDDEATAFARTKLAEGAIKAEKSVYVNHELRETKRMTQKKPYWH